jgi:hypothetical protein
VIMDMSNKRMFKEMGYRELQQHNSTSKLKLTSAEVLLLKRDKYKNVGWDNIINLYLRIDELLKSIYRLGWSLDELFIEADRIGNKYQSSAEIYMHQQQVSILAKEIDDDIDRHFPDLEPEIINFS